MILKIGAAVLVVLVALGLVIATRPAHFRIERSALIHAPSAAVFPLIDDFHNWPKWSPWEKLDPGMEKTFSGAPAGKGAEYAWRGNDKAGEGKMTLLDSKPNELVSVKLEFLKPFAATNLSTFKLIPSGADTQVLWSMEGENGFIAKGFSMLMNMDAMVGKDFAEGLANLDKLAQSAPAAAPAPNR